jgi:hypothetical protein
LIELHSQEGITALIRRRKSARRIYNCLNKHDREWLLLHQPPKKMPQRTKGHLRATFRSMRVTSDKSRREKRDASTSQAIISTAHKITNSSGEPRRVTRVQLEKAAPGVGWLLSNPENFPLTTQAFKEAKETREAFALRRIRWALQRYKDESIRPTRKEFILRAKAKNVLDILSVRTAIEEALAMLRNW